MTTVVVFLPLVLLSGLVGSFFTALALTLASAVILSMLFAIFVLPLLAARFLRRRSGPHEPPSRTSAVSAVSAMSATEGDPVDGSSNPARLRRGDRRGHRRDRLGTTYARLLHRVLRRRRIAFVVVAAAIAGGVLLWRVLPSGFLPEMDEGAFVLDYFMPSGTSLAATRRRAAVE